MRREGDLDQLRVEPRLIGLLLGAEADWPTAFESLVRRIGTLSYLGDQHTLETERVRIHPFNLRDTARQMW